MLENHEVPWQLQIGHMLCLVLVNGVGQQFLNCNAIIVGKLLHRTPNTHGVHMWILWKWEIKYGIALLVQMLANMQQWL
jgi:hypothetical protein